MTNLKEAMFYEKQENENIKCQLCPHHCMILPGRTGSCGVRENQGGVLFSKIYSRVSSIALDPIEKKPFNRFHPGSFILSVGSVGCNFKCPFCQNYEIVCAKPHEMYTGIISSEELIKKALELKSRGNIGIAFTYNEPSVWYEFVYETARLAKENDLLNVLVTNGFISVEPLQRLLPFIDAMNIDLKAFNSDFYKNIVKGSLEDVKTTIKAAAEKCHVEITTLIIPGLNDSAAEMEEEAKWLAAISKELPLHLSRFFPRFKMLNIPATPVETLVELSAVARKYLRYVYMGNI